MALISEFKPGDVTHQITLVTNSGLTTPLGSRLFINGQEVGNVEDASLMVSLGSPEGVPRTELYVKLAGCQGEILPMADPSKYAPPPPEKTPRDRTNAVIANEVRKFISDMDITAEETIFQTDRVAENSLDLIHQLYLALHGLLLEDRRYGTK